MADINEADQEKAEGTSSDSSMKFTCPEDGDISRDDVLFLCNTCSRDELIHQDGVYMCPSCLEPGENFECLLCGSKEVTMKAK